MTYQELEKVNQEITTIDVKGKDYAEVPQRVQAFRKLFPEGLIQTDIISIENGVVLMKSFIYDNEGKLLATGMAQEKESSSFINKTSYIENCETSAVGRALGMLGIGSKTSIASAEEVKNAINNQSKNNENVENLQSALDNATKRGKASEAKPEPVEEVKKLTAQEAFKITYEGQTLAAIFKMKDLEKRDEILHKLYNMPEYTEAITVINDYLAKYHANK